MSNAILDMKARLAADLARVRKDTPATSGHKISLKGKVFTFPDGRQSRNPIDVVLLDWRIYNQYFKGAYNPTKIEKPTCFAISQTMADMKPSERAPVKQGADCASCALNQFGSAATGRGKACKNGRRLAVVPVDADMNTPIFTIEVSPTGIKALDGYISKLAAGHGLVPIQVITTVAMNPNEAYPTLMFAPGAPLNEEKLGVMLQLAQAAQPILDAEPDIAVAVVAP